MVAAQALAAIGPEGLSVLAGAIQGNDIKVRIACAIVLAEANPIGTLSTEYEKIIPLLLNCLKDKDVYLRSVAIGSLGLIGRQPEIVIPVLIECLKDGHEEIRKGASLALRRYGYFPDSPKDSNNQDRINK